MFLIALKKKKMLLTKGICKILLAPTKIPSAELWDKA